MTRTHEHIRTQYRRDFHGLPIAPDAFGEAVVKLRASYGCTNWGEFCHTFRRETGFQLSQGTMQHMGPRYLRGGPPNPEPLYILEKSGLFTFANGEPVSLGAFYEIFYAARDSDGNRLK